MSTSATENTFLYSIYGSDHDLQEIVALFVEEMPDRIEALLSHLNNRDWNQLGRTAHVIKGAAGTYGFDQFTPVAQRVESQVREGRPEAEILQSVEALVDLCRRARPGTADEP